MITYRLTFHDDHLGAAKYVEFEGRSPADALSHLADERAGRRAELSRSGNYIATLRRTANADGLWIIDRPDDRPAAAQTRRKPPHSDPVGASTR